MNPHHPTRIPSLSGAHAFLVATTISTFILITSGALVTSHGAGLAVPDWPTTFGYNMFTFPISRWVDGIFFEHVHRLIASVIALFTLISMVWLLAVDSRRWVKVLVVAAAIAVLVQALLGGLRVVWLKDEIGIFHALLAQSFFVSLGILTVSTSQAFLDGRWAPAVPAGNLRWMMAGLVAVIFLQLGIAATMRHSHTGLSIPDFPAAYGKVLPDTSAAEIARINTARIEAGEVPTTATQIWLQMAHRFVAFVILGLVALFARRSYSLRGVPTVIRRWALVLVGMVIVQIGLGAWTIWSNKAADIASLHMAVGALMLFVCGRLAFQLFAMEHSRLRLKSNVPAVPRAGVAA